MTLYIHSPVNRAISRPAPERGDFAKLHIKTGVATACSAGRDCVHPVSSCDGSAYKSQAHAISTLAVTA